MKHFLLTLLLCTAAFAQVSPFEGLGNAQFFDNNGNVLTSGVLYSYQAGTSSQQATYTDGTGAVQNPNPISFTIGGRAGIWLTSGAFYKFVLCLQNDGPSCAPADVLFSVDQVPGSPAGTSSGGGGPPFISGSANPATSGVLRLASADSICWRNAANSANLCVSKDTNDVLAWVSAIKFQEIGCVNSSTGFDYLCADATSHRLKESANGSGQAILAVQGNDIGPGDVVTQVHFGATAAPISGSLPSATQYLCVNGMIGGCTFTFESIFGIDQPTPNNGINANCGMVGGLCAETVFANAHTITRVTFMLNSNPPFGCGALLIVGVRDLTSSTNLYTSTIANSQAAGFVDSGALSISITAGHTIGIGAIQTENGCSNVPAVAYLRMVYQ